MSASGTSEARPGSPLHAGLGLLLLIVLPWRGGAAPLGTLLWHGTVVALVLALAAVPRLAGARRHGPAPAPVAAFALLLAVAAVGALLAPYRYAALLMLLELSAFAAVVWLSSRAGPRLPPGLATTLLLAALVESALVLRQRYVEGTDRPAGSFENTNHLGSWLVAVLLLQAGSLLAPGSGRARALRAAGAVPLLAALLLGGSRGALLGLAVGALYLLWSEWNVWPRPVRIAALALLALGALVLGGRQWQRLGQADPFRYQRVRIWTASYAAGARSPWTGVGPRQFGAAAENLQFADGEGPLRYDRTFRRTHSDPLRVFAELGLPGLLALVLAVGAAVAVIARSRPGREESVSPDRRAGSADRARAGAVAALLALSTHCWFANLSERPAVWVLAAALLGGLIARPSGSGGADHRPTVAPSGRLALAALLVAGFVVADVSPYLAWRDAGRLPADVLPSEARGRLERAMLRNPLHPLYRLRLAGAIAGSEREWDLNGYARARELAEGAVRLQPADARYRAGLARIEGRAARTLFAGDAVSRRRAATRFLEAESLSRYNPYLPLERAALLLDTGDPLGAQRAARRALAVEPESSAARLVLAEALLAAGGPGVERRVRELVEEASAIAERWSGQRLESPESARLLELDPRALARIREGLASRRAERGDDER